MSSRLSIVSSAPSIVSVDAILLDKSETSPSVQDAGAAESWVKRKDSLVIDPSGNRTSMSVYPRVDEVDRSFVRHHKYFFKDGNITFLVDGTLYCVHRYFFSRDSIYFCTRFSQLDIRDHEAFPTIVSLGDIERKDFDAFLSILYPENFEGVDLSYEEWKSVLHLSTRWGFASIRKLALNAIEPPTPHDRLRLARTYSVDDWVVPALSALCERRAPLSLDEARHMSIEDVVVVATVREDIRNHALRIDAAEIPLRVEAAQAGKLVDLDCVNVPLAVPASGAVEWAPSLADPKRATKEGDAHESDGERSVGPVAVLSDERVWNNGIDESLKVKEEAPGDSSMHVQVVETAQPMQSSRGEVVARPRANGEPANRLAEEATKHTAEEEAARRAAEEEARIKARREADRARRLGGWGMLGDAKFSPRRKK